jgi:hypothetical protein
MTVCLLLQAPEERQAAHEAGRKQSPALMKRGRFFIGSSIVERAGSAQTREIQADKKTKRHAAPSGRAPLQDFNDEPAAPERRPASLARACA